MKHIFNFPDFISEALGVPEGIIETSKELFLKFLNNIEIEADVQELENEILTVEGDFKILDMNFQEVDFVFDFEIIEEDEIDFLGMGSKFTRGITIDKNKKSFEVKTLSKQTLEIAVTLITSEQVLGKDLFNFFKKNEKYFIPVIAHELKHFYDKFKKPKKSLKTWVDYGVYSTQKFADVKPLNDFLFLSYYVHSFESLVRSTEFAAMLDIENVTPEKFKEFFLSSEMFTILKTAREYNLTDFKKSLEDYQEQILDCLIIFGYDTDELVEASDEELVEFILKEFYEQLMTWKGSLMKSALFPIMTPFRFVGKKEKYFNEYLEKILKFGGDYNKFFETEFKFMNQEATRVIKKVAGTYPLTFKNL